MNSLQEVVAPHWLSLQTALFAGLESELGPLTEKQQRLVQVLEIIRIEGFIPRYFRMPGRPPSDRVCIARAFVAKAVYDMPTTRILLDRLATDVSLRRLCGWERKSEVPSESVFSRSFAVFAATELNQRVHESLIRKTHQSRLVGHISRDSTAIVAREKPVQKDPPPPPPVLPKRKLGRPRKGEERPKAPKPPTRLQRQSGMSKQQMLDDLSKVCDTGAKKDSKGNTEFWVGYKLHIDAADGQIPVTCILTSASLHDSQAAIPLATLTAERITNLYDIMDGAYDSDEIRQHSRSLGHVPIIEINPRRNQELKQQLQAEAKRLDRIGFQMPESVRYNERTTVERVNGRFKDEFGGRHIRVRGADKVMCHCMFGILALTADQLMRFAT